MTVKNGGIKSGRKSNLKIKLDYDFDDLEKILERISLIEKMAGRIFSIKRCGIKKSPSGRGYHVEIEIVPLTNLDEKDLVIIQLLLGSDRKREFFNWIRVRGKQKYWNVLFKEKLELSAGEEKSL